MVGIYIGSKLGLNETIHSLKILYRGLKNNIKFHPKYLEILVIIH